MARTTDDQLTDAEFLALGPHRWLARALWEQQRRLESALERLEAPEVDTEAIHDLRVTTRRIRGILDAGSSFISGKGPRRLARRLKSIRRELGAAREAEVGAELLAGIKSELSPDARSAAGSLAAQLVGHRHDLDGAVASGAAGLAPGKLRRRLARVIESLEERDRAGNPTRQISLDEFRRRALEVLHERWRVLRELPLLPLERHDAEAQHRYRIEAKKLRYGLELFAPLFPPPIQRRIALLKAMQDQLGRLHDLADLAVLARSLGAGAGEAGFVEAAFGFAELAGHLDAERHRGFAGFHERHRALMHPGFLPPLVVPVNADAVGPAADNAVAKGAVVDGAADRSADPVGASGAETNPGTPPAGTREPDTSTGTSGAPPRGTSGAPPPRETLREPPREPPREPTDDAPSEPAPLRLVRSRRKDP